MKKGLYVNDELERKWSWPNLRYYTGISLEELRRSTKISVSIAGIRGEI
jgi:hypothetical protein